eukprot:7407040-Pyramimonas_sp.AAC.3
MGVYGDDIHPTWTRLLRHSSSMSVDTLPLSVRLQSTHPCTITFTTEAASSSTNEQPWRGERGHITQLA